MAVRKAIITCAVTGATHTPSMSDALPLTPAQIAEEAVAVEARRIVGLNGSDAVATH